MSQLLRRLATLAFAAPLAACQPVPDTIQIGVAQPLSGALKSLGQDMLDGAAMAVADINREGLKVDGKLVKLALVSADDQADAEAGKAAARQLIDAKVVAVIGHLNSGVSMAAAPLYAEHHIPQLAISTKPEYTAMGLPTTFRLVASDALQSQAMGGFAAKRPGEHRFAVVDDKTPYGQGLAQAAEARLTSAGKTATLHASLDDKTTDFAKLVEDIKAQRVDTIVTTLADFQVVALADQLVKAGLSHMTIVGGDTIKTEGLRGINPAVGEVYATSPVIAAGEFGGGKDFLVRFRSTYHHEPVYAAHYAYDAVHVLAASIRQAGSVDGQTLVKVLKTIDPPAPVTSSMRFAENGEQRYGAVSIYQLLKGDWFLLGRGDRW